MSAQKNDPAEQQAANAALCSLASVGNSFAVGQLWEINKGFIYQQTRKWLLQHQQPAENAGFTVDDLNTEAFFALKSAAEHYNPCAGARFTSYLVLWLNQQLGRAVLCGSGKHISGEDGKECYVQADPLCGCDRLDEPLPGGESEDVTKLDMLEDPAAECAFGKVEDTEYSRELHEKLDAAIQRLDEQHQTIIRARFLENATLKAAGAQVGMNLERVRQQEVKALHLLRRDTDLRQWHDAFMENYAYHGTGLKSWLYRGSVEERAIEELDARGGLFPGGKGNT